MIERRDRDRRRDEVVAREVGEQVDVALDQRRLRDDEHRVARLDEHLEQRARHTEAALERLPGIGRDADRDRLRTVARLRERLPKEPRRVALDVQPTLEVEPGRVPEPRVTRSREAVDAAVLAAAVGIDRAIEMQVRRLVARDQRARGVLAPDGARACRSRRLVLVVGRRVPAVVDVDAGQRLEAAARVGERATTLRRPGRERADRVIGSVGRSGGWKARRARHAGSSGRLRRAGRGDAGLTHGVLGGCRYRAVADGAVGSSTTVC